MTATPLPLRTRLALAAGDVAGAASRWLGRGDGGVIPGRVTARLAPAAFAQLSAGRPVLMVSGTNGKTTTTRFLAAALRGSGPVVSNEDGANLLPGLTTALLRGRRLRDAPAVLEVDEVALPLAMTLARPRVVVLLNLSRDQLDRTGEVATNVRRWSQAVAAAPGCVVVANADDPLVAALVLTARPDAVDVVWVATGSTWRADATQCPRCGAALSSDRDYACPTGDFRRPTPHWSVEGEQLHPPAGPPLPVRLGLPGRANIGNAALAVAAAAQEGVPAPAALERLLAVTEVSGRYLQVQLPGGVVQLLLAKNPAGWAEALDVVGERDHPVVLAINAQEPDGTDPSWLWDAPFERLRGRRVVVTGERRWDLAVRLTYAEVEHTVVGDVLDGVRSLAVPRCDVVANYTAFRTARAALLGAGRPVAGVAA